MKIVEWRETNSDETSKKGLSFTDMKSKQRVCTTYTELGVYFTYGKYITVVIVVYLNFDRSPDLSDCYVLMIY